MRILVEVGKIITLWMVIAFCLLALFGCSKSTPVDSAFNSVHESIVAVKDSLPEECKTDAILRKIDNIENKSVVAESVCNSKIKEVQTRFERTLGALIIMILLFLGKFFLKI